jgi:hypothetical protein
VGPLGVNGNGKKILFRNGELNLLLPGSGYPLQAGTGYAVEADWLEEECVNIDP